MDHNDEVIGGRGIGLLATPNVEASNDDRLRRANAVLQLLHGGIKNKMFAIRIRSDQIQLRQQQTLDLRKKWCGGGRG